jgi:ubiquinone biosynthesis protein
MVSRKQSVKVERLSRPQGFRMALEELGPTYIKLGQILSTRPDLVPLEFIKELSKLQDKVPPVPFSAIEKIVETELRFPMEEVFVQFSQEPLASASIGQVHQARLKGGQEVAVKVQRPGIQKIIEVDLEIMLHMATLMEKHIEELALHRPVTIVEEFAKTLERELDYTIEALSMERMAANFADSTELVIPKVYPELTTPSVITTEFIKGIKISELDLLERAGLDTAVITRRGADIVLRQVFEYGFFQADPHPGNIFVLPENIICLIDFGMVGTVDRKTKEYFVDLIHSVVHQDAQRTAQVILKLTYWDHEPDMRLFEKEVADFMMHHLHRPLKDIHIGRLLQQLLEVASRNRLRIPADIFLMLKALTTVEGVARMLNPEFNMIAQATPFIQKVYIDRYTPKRMAEELFRMTSDLKQFVEQFPKDVLDILRLIRQRKLQLNVEHQGLPDILSTHDRVSNRISFSIIIAAMIIGSALIVISEIPPLFYGISLIGIIGFLAAALMGIWLLVAILRKGRL